jgi:hypothetical protein
LFEIGNSLREARERQGRTFADLERKTQIRTRYLRAMEDEQFSLLPALAYTRGFLRVYAEELGLDGQLYIDEFNSRFTVGEEEQTATRRREVRVPAQSRRSRRIASGAVVLSLAVIAVVVALFFAAFASQPKKPEVANLKPSSSQGKVTTLKVTAVRGDTFVDVRYGGENGDPVYQGTLVKGHSKTFKASSIWIKVVAVQNLRWTLPGGISAPFTNRVGPATLLFTPEGHKVLSG